MTSIEARTVRSDCVPSPDGNCSVCGDEAVLGRVIAIDADGIATVAFGETTSAVALDLVDGVAVGDSVMVHLGFAIARVEGA